MNKAYFLIFISIFASIYAGLHYYVYQRIASGLTLSAHAALYFRIFIYAGAASFFVSEILSRRITGSWGETAAWAGFTWLGIISIAFTALLLRDILLIFFNFPAFKYLSAVSAAVIIASVSAFSLWNGGRTPSLKTIELAPLKLPESASGFTIIQLSDLHIDLQTPLWWVKNVVERANALNPDVIVVTGDLLDADLRKKPEFIEVLSKLKAKHGVFATTGNHECFTGLEMFNDVARKAGMTVLHNENRKVAGVFTLVGIEDPEVARFGNIRRDLDKALVFPAAVDASRPVVLLSHRPDIFEKAAAKGVELTLSGHTHYGQIPPADLYVKLFEKYSCGFHRKGGSFIYTTSGTGTWGPPMRLFSRSEIVKITLL